MQNLILRLGLAKSALLLTAISSLFSVFLFVLLYFIWGGVLIRGVAFCIIISAVVTPVLTYYFLRITIRLARSEKARRESQENYKELANSLPQIVFETDVNGTITFANQNAFDVFGVSQNDLANGLNALNMLTPHEREILFLWAVEGFTVQDIANDLGIPKGTILSRLHRLKIKVKNKFGAGNKIGEAI